MKANTFHIGNPILVQLFEMTKRASLDHSGQGATFSCTGVICKTLMLLGISALSGFAFTKTQIAYLSLSAQLFWMMGMLFALFTCLILHLIYVRHALIFAFPMSVIMGVYGALIVHFMDTFTLHLGVKTISIVLAVFSVVLALFQMPLFVFRKTRKTLLTGLSIIITLYVLYLFISTIYFQTSDIHWFVQWVYPFLMLALVTCSCMLDAFILSCAEQNGMPKKAEWYAAGGLCFSLIWAFFIVLSLIGKPQKT